MHRQGLRSDLKLGWGAKIGFLGLPTEKSRIIKEQGNGYFGAMPSSTPYISS